MAAPGQADLPATRRPHGRGRSLVAPVPLGLIVCMVVSKGARHHQLGLPHRGHPPPVPHQGGGMGPAVVGTIVITGAASLMAIPLGVLGAVYLNEYGGTGVLARSDPVHVRRHDRRALDRDGPVHLRGLGAGARGASRASPAPSPWPASCCPIVIRTTEEMLKLVPDELRRGQPWRSAPARCKTTTARWSLPAALPGIISGRMLAVARAAGETAPLLFTISVRQRVATGACSGANTALPPRSSATPASPSPAPRTEPGAPRSRSWLLVFLLTLVARFVAAPGSR